MKIKFLIYLGLALFILSCEEDDSSVNPKMDIPVLDIIDAESLVILESSSEKSLDENGTGNFYKITTDGSFEEVKFINADGSGLDDGATETYIDVASIFNVNQEFLILSGMFTVWDTTGNVQMYDNLLVRKSDGAIFDFLSFNNDDDIDLANKFIDMWMYQPRPGESWFPSDKNDNFYLMANYGMVFKVDAANPASLNISEYLPEGQGCVNFGIDSDGNCIYRYGDDGFSSKYRVRKKEGGLYEVEVDGETNGEFWIGDNDNKFYFISKDEFYYPSINKLAFVNGEAQLEKVWSDQTEEFLFVSDLEIDYGRSYVVRKNNGIVFIDLDGYQSWEFSETDNSVRKINLPNFDVVREIKNSPNYLYIAASMDLYKISLDTYNYTSLLPSGEYDIYTIDVTDDDLLQVSALRFSDAKKVLIEIDNAGSMNITEYEDSRRIITLQQLN